MACDNASDYGVNFNVNHPRGEDDDVRGDNGDSAYCARESPHRSGPQPHIKPDPFTGEEDWDHYIIYFEDCTKQGQWSEKEKLLHLATSLK